MTTIHVLFSDLSRKNYPVHIELGVLARFSALIPLESYSKVIILTDTNLSESILPRFLAHISAPTAVIEIPPGEMAKNVDTLQKIWGELVAVGADRKSLLINLGGGVIGDLGGFAASTFMRGIDFVQVPTTLLAQVDASIGGKVAIDFGGIKNSIGAFNQPMAVLIDPSVLRTLPRRELVSGFAEIIKHGAILDASYFQSATRSPVWECSDEQLQSLILRSCELKQSVVEGDEKESGCRKILNFGHTFGHAIEALHLEASLPMTHGEAVALGMLFESQLSHRIGLLAKHDVDQIRFALEMQGLPTHCTEQWSYEAILEKMQKDKKNSLGKIRWSLIDRIGSCRFDVEVPDQEVRATLETWAWGEIA
jgi:3-dehydroquinate synthase